MRARLIAAFAAVYVIWGSTYLAMRFAIETLPPFFMLGARFGLAGLILLAWSRWHDDAPPPTARDWTVGGISGTLMLFGGTGAVIWAERRVPSGIAAILVAIVPLWMVLLDWSHPSGRRPRPLVFVGLSLGLAGLALLVGPDALHGDASMHLPSVAILMLGSFTWAMGSVVVQRAPRPSTGMNGSATQMIVGGAILTVAALLHGELRALGATHASTRSVLAFVYLVTFGSLVGFTAYNYLLGHTSAAKAATYAYVNPVVAVLLGWLLASEPVTSRTLVAAAVILAGVAIITVARDQRPAKRAPSERAAA